MELYERIKRDILSLCLFAVVLQAAWLVLPLFRDDTDGARRSGLSPRTDARTGCQYLETAGGGITPRLDRDGRQICER